MHVFVPSNLIVGNQAFYLWHHSWSKKFQSRRKVCFLWVGLVFPIYYVETVTFWNSKWQRKICLKISFEKCVCWRWGHNVLERKWSKSSVFSSIFFFKRLWHHKESLIRSEHGSPNKMSGFNNPQLFLLVIFLGHLKHVDGETWCGHCPALNTYDLMLTNPPNLSW